MARLSHTSLLLPLLAVLMLLSSNSDSAAAARDPFTPILRFFTGLEETAVAAAEAEAEAAEQCGPQLSIETPSCTVVDKGDGYEVRSYPEGQVWVQTIVENSPFSIATSIGFYRCFNFISGQNEKKEEIEMTGPVLIKPVPEKSGYSISFFAPSRFSKAADLPKPNNALVKFVETNESLHAVIGPFGGFATDSDYKKKWQQLKAKLDKSHIHYDESSVVYAGYSSPFEIFNRKQEVHVILN